jgi:hypothetical protein
MIIGLTPLTPMTFDAAHELGLSDAVEKKRQ